MSPSRHIVPWPWVMRVGNGGAIMTSRRVRGPAAHRAAGGEPSLASRGLQNSQRVLHAKPRTAPMARRRDGDIAPYRNGTAPRGTGRAPSRVMACEFSGA